MKFSLGLVLSAATAFGAVIHSELVERQTIDGNCIPFFKYIGIYNGDLSKGYSQACANLVNDCERKSNNTEYLFSKTSCVAAATCQGAGFLYTVANCSNPSIPDVRAQVPSLSYNVYANIVGSCAWEPNGCPIHFQQYVDWFYGALTAINSSSWPDSVDSVKKTWWDPMLDWAKTGDTLPYTNFNDWLHYSQ